MITFVEIAVTVLLFVWAIFVVVVLTRRLYTWMTKRGIEHKVAVYYNRKTIHILTGGVCAVVTPFVFRTALIPFVMAMLLAIFIYALRKAGRAMYWFQITENTYEVSFCIMWGVIILLGWWVSGGDFWLGTLPVIFMSVGDAVTGIVRNYLYKKRTKSWWGNLVMAAFSMTVGSALGAAGVVAGGLAAFVEHYEFYPIDDNVTIPLFSFLTLLLARIYAPWMLAF